MVSRGPPGPQNHRVSKRHYASPNAAHTFCVKATKSMMPTYGEWEKRFEHLWFIMLFQKQTLRSPTTEARSPTGAHQLGRKLRESDVSIANHSLFRKTCKNVLLSHVTPSSLVRLFSASRPNREITMRNRHVMPSPQRLPDEMPWTNWLLFVLFVSVRCCHRLQHPFISFIVTAPHTVIDIISVYVISFNVSQFIGG